MSEITEKNEALTDDDLWSEFDAADTGKPITSRGDIGVETNESDFEEGDGEGGDGEGGDTPPVGAEDIDKDVATGDENEEGLPAETAAPSLWDDAPPELKKEYEALAAEKARLEQRERSAAGRAVGFQRRYEELQKAAKPRPVDEDRPTLDAALAALKEDYPEIAEPLTKALGGIEGRVKDLSEAEEGRRTAAEAELNDYVQRETEAVLEAHPDYLEVLGKNSDKLAEWVNDQPLRVREAFIRNQNEIVNGAEAAEIVTKFKAHLGLPVPGAPAPSGRPPLSDKRERQKSATASPSNRGRRPTPSGIPEDGDPQDIWNAFEAMERR